MKSRVRGILIKWFAMAGIITFLWFAGFFHLMLAIFLVFIGEVNLFLDWLQTGTELGRQEYWSAYGRYWFIGYVVLSVVLAVIYFIPYRKARPILKVGNRKEGTVTFIKGIRRGLTYEAWDVWNYLKKTEPTPMGWPNPLAIPRGPTMNNGICIVYRCPWSWKSKYLYIPDTARLESRLTSVHIPDGYFVNKPNPDRLDVQDLIYTDRSTIGYDRFDTSVPAELHTDHLKRSRKMVQRSVASNPEINQMDFTTGSFAVMGADED